MMEPHGYTACTESVTGGEMSTDDQRRIREHVAGRVERDLWGPGEAISWTADRDLVNEFYAVVAFTRLCTDGAQPHHRNAHRATGIRQCVGPGFVDHMARRFGFSEERTKFLLDQHDAALRAFEGQSGAGGA